MAADVQAEGACQYFDSDDPSIVCKAAVAADQRCLAHLTPDARTAWLATLAPGADIDARGVTFSQALLTELLDALRDPQDRPQIGTADFTKAIFIGTASFSGATFTKDARFDHATFIKDARFELATFTGRARFDHATFTEGAWFVGASIRGTASFVDATFAETALFSGVTFARDAFFASVTFTRDTWFVGASVGGTASFEGTVVQSEFQVEAAARWVRASGLHGEGRVSLRLRAAEVDLSDVVLVGSVSVHGLDHPINGVDETAFAAGAGRVSPVRVLSLRGLDASSVTLTDVDLSQCRFAGLRRADQIMLDGRCVFADGPGGRRRVLAEEHHWRATRAGANRAARASDRPRQTGGWQRLPEQASEHVEVVDPARLEVLYRQLRKALEDAKNEPGAGDFYYGEMQMRREATTRRTERWLLGLYWAISGYGLRARRALAWLALLTALSIIGLTWFGFPQTAKDQNANGTVTAPGGQQPITLTIRQSEPVKPLASRVEKATEVTLNAVIFRSPDAELTPPGRYLNITIRILGPILLGLTILAIRNQVKR